MPLTNNNTTTSNSASSLARPASRTTCTLLGPGTVTCANLDFKAEGNDVLTFLKGPVTIEVDGKSKETHPGDARYMPGVGNISCTSDVSGQTTVYHLRSSEGGSVSFEPFGPFDENGTRQWAAGGILSLLRETDHLPRTGQCTTSGIACSRIEPATDDKMKLTLCPPVDVFQQGKIIDRYHGKATFSTESGQVSWPAPNGERIVWSVTDASGRGAPVSQSLYGHWEVQGDVARADEFKDHGGYLAPPTVAGYPPSLPRTAITSHPRSGEGITRLNKLLGPARVTKQSKGKAGTSSCHSGASGQSSSLGRELERIKRESTNGSSSQ